MFRFFVRLAVVMSHCERSAFDCYHLELHAVQREMDTLGFLRIAADYLASSSILLHIFHLSFIFSVALCATG